MPKVGKKDFAYTSAGVKQAQDHARKTGQKMVLSKKGGKVKKLKKGGVKKKHHGGRVSGGMKDKQC